MRGARAVFRLLRVVLHGVHGLWVVLVYFPFLDESSRHERIRWWSGKLLRQLGVALRVDGRFRSGAKLVVANHVSWLDITAIHAICPEARFVSKADVQRWPLVGRLVASAGTLYIQRDRRRDAMRVVHQMAEALRLGHTVAVFPEGTTDDGRSLLPFHANLLQAAIATATPVQPVALRYSDARHDVSPAALFLGETTMAQTFWSVAGAEGLTANLSILAPEETAHADRRALAEHLRQQIAAQLDLPARAA